MNSLQEPRNAILEKNEFLSNLEMILQLTNHSFETRDYNRNIYFFSTEEKEIHSRHNVFK